MNKFEYKGLTIKIVQDTDAGNPRKEFDHMGTMVCFHKRYDLGDKSDLSIEELQELVNRKNVIALPLFLMDHGGISMSTGSYGCEWDSGQVGYIYIEKSKALKEFQAKRMTKKLEKRILESLKSEVNEYNQYLQGDVYGFQIETGDGEYLDSCYGFYGIEFCEEEAKMQADYYAESELESEKFASNYGMATI